MRKREINENGEKATGTGIIFGKRKGGISLSLSLSLYFCLSFSIYIYIYGSMDTGW